MFGLDCLDSLDCQSLPSHVDWLALCCGKWLKHGSGAFRDQDLLTNVISNKQRLLTSSVCLRGFTQEAITTINQWTSGGRVKIRTSELTKFESSLNFLHQHVVLFPFWLWFPALATMLVDGLLILASVGFSRRFISALKKSDAAAL